MCVCLNTHFTLQSRDIYITLTKLHSTVFSGRFLSVVAALPSDLPVCSPGHVRPDLRQTLGQVAVLIHLGAPAEPEEEKQDVMSAD